MSRASGIALKDFYNIEHRVNGFWNSLLFDYFKTEPIAPSATSTSQSVFYISPEVYPKPDATSGVRADLVLSKMTYNATTEEADFMTVLAYEGKGAEGETLDRARTQQEDWFTKARLSGASPIRYCITAGGSLVKFYIWEPRYGPRALTPIWWDNAKGKLVKGDQGGEPQAPKQPKNNFHAYDLCVTEDFEGIKRIMKQIQTNVGAPDHKDNGDVPKS